MHKIKALKLSFRNISIAAGLSAGLGLGAANVASAESAEIQPHSDGLGATVSDSAITVKVKAKLMGTDGLGKSDINVTTTNGVVTLDGSASSSNAKAAAETAVKSVDGVKSVDNNLKTPSSNKVSEKAGEAASKAGRIVSDSWITTKVKSEILADSLTKGFDVNVETVHGVVVLKGALANQDAIDHVKDLAEKVDGVKSVDTSALVVAGK